jgi:plasmid stabilization system protein ParE
VSYRLSIRPDALRDIEEAAAWYEEQQAGLGADFVRTIRTAIRSLPAHPLIHPLRDRRRNVRSLRPPRFPYRVFFRLRGHLITVFAVIHTARHDRQWKERL